MPAPALFETVHREASTLRYHSHGIAFATIVLSGTYTEVRDGTPESRGAGSIVLHGTGEHHADHFTSAARCLNLEFSRPFAWAGPDDVSWGAALDAEVASLVRAFSAIGSSSAPVLRARAARVETLLRAGVARSAPPAPPWLAIVLRDFDWLDAGPLRGAARCVDLHPTHFSRAFRKHVGMTPNAYRRRARIRHASNLLLASSAPISRVAQHCGFDDQSHLTRTFARALGLTPAVFRRVFAR